MNNDEIKKIISSEVNFDEKILRTDNILLLVTDCSDCACK